MVRVGSNFLRLGVNFLIGVLLVRLLLRHDLETYSVYALIVVGIGVGAMLKELTRIAIVPSLGKAYGETGQAFTRAYSSSFVVAGVLAVIGAGFMLSLIPILPRFSIAETQLADAQGFLLLRAMQAALIVFAAPLLNLLLLGRKFVLSNLLLVCERLVELAAVWMLVNDYVLVAGGLTQIALVSLLSLVVLYAGVALILVRQNREFWPRFSAVSKQQILNAAGLFGWTAVLVLGMNLFLRFDLIFVNIVLGVGATALFALAVQATGMIQQITNGIVGGIDANAAHLMKQDGGRDKLLSALKLSSGQQAFIVAPIGMAVILLAPDLLRLWLGPEALSEDQFASAALVIRIMIAGILVRGFAEVWMYALNGIGCVGDYSRWLLVAALLNPPLVFAAAFLMTEGSQLVGVAIVFMVLHIIAYGALIPWVASNAFGTSWLEIVRPFLFPIAASIGISAVLLFGQSMAGIVHPLARIALVGAVLSAIPMAGLGPMILGRIKS